MSDTIVKAFSQMVHDFWTHCIHGTNGSTLCESSLIQLTPWEKCQESFPALSCAKAASQSC
ncbi:hypothetical protein C8J57DRAFT_1282025 [Mycena rebaudengoi]|nr:hypothetical protein C8J57DRAFT_1282025 [Mycena rebaudengoi]